jgi:flagellar biosynthesis protein FliP
MGDLVLKKIYTSHDLGALVPCGGPGGPFLFRDIIVIEIIFTMSMLYIMVGTMHYSLPSHITLIVPHGSN